MRDKGRTWISGTVVRQIEAFIERQGGDHSAFVVGVAADIEDRLAKHGVDRGRHKCLVLNAVTDKRADAIVQHFTEKGCQPGATENAGKIYCYRRAFDTNP
jgi:hypothetical protein